MQGKENLRARLLQESSLTAADVELLNSYRNSVADGYLSHPNVAVGSQDGWVRTFARHYAHSKLIENDFAPPF